jgi:hypothetical protein
MPEMKPLAMFHKNRELQIRRGTDLEQLYHVCTEMKAANIGPRAEKVSLTEVISDFVFHMGYAWMRMDFKDEQGLLFCIAIQY